MSSETVSKANTCGYYLRAKRRKGNNEQEFEDSKEVGRNSYPQKWKCPIMRMPTEIIQNILKYLSYTDLCNFNDSYMNLPMIVITNFCQLNVSDL